MNIMDVASKLGEFRSAVKGTLPAYRGQQEQNERERNSSARMQLVRDAVASRQYLEDGEPGRVSSLMQQRMQEVGSSPVARGYADMARRLQSGDLEGAKGEIDTILDVAKRTGVISQGQYQKGSMQVLKDENDDLFFATMSFDPATNQGGLIVVDPSGREAKPYGKVSLVDTLGLTADQRVTQKGSEAEAAASGTATGSATAGRVQDVIQRGVEAARAMPMMRRTKDLLEEVKTGGWEKPGLWIKQTLGIESADEGELSRALGVAVLSQLKETFGAQFTAEEGKRLEKLEAGLQKSAKANMRIINQLIKLNEKKVDQALKAARASNDDFTVSEIESYMEFRIDDTEAANTFGARPIGNSIKVLSVQPAGGTQ